MNATQYIKRPPNRADWLALRRGYVGGSEIAAILGVSPWRTAVDVYLDKLGRAPEDDADPAEALRLGAYLEQYAADRYAETTGRAVRNYGYMVVRDHALADVDRLIVPDGAKIASFREEIRAAGILECKTSGVAWGDEIPVHYQAQGQLYAELLDCAFVDFAVVFLAPRRAFRVFRLERDRAVGTALVAAVERFWPCVERDEPPTCATLADARALYPRGGTSSRAATPEIAADLRRLRAVNSAIEDLEEKADALKGKIAGYMGDADELTVGGVKAVTFRAPAPRSVTDWRAVADDLARAEEPERVKRVIAAHTEDKPGVRRLVCMGAKEAGK